MPCEVWHVNHSLTSLAFLALSSATLWLYKAWMEPSSRPSSSSGVIATSTSLGFCCRKMSSLQDYQQTTSVLHTIVYCLLMCLSSGH